MLLIWEIKQLKTGHGHSLLGINYDSWFVIFLIQFVLYSPTLRQIKNNFTPVSHFIIMYLFRTVYSMPSCYTIFFSINFFVHSNCEPSAHNLTTLDRLLATLMLRFLKFQKGTEFQRNKYLITIPFIFN